MDKIDGVKQRGIGQNVSTAPGDSGSPLLIEEGSNTKKIIGVLYGGNSYVKNEELCVKEGYKEGSEIWRDCRFFSDYYSNPVSSYNMPFLEKVVDNYGAIIPGVQVGVRVIEYNGKVKILYKEEKTSFNENVEEYKVVNKFNNNRYNTVEALKQAWRGTDFYERSKASWVFE